MAALPHNHRASLLAGLRTGGVRSVSTPMPHTAAPAGSFHIPQIHRTPSHQGHFFPEEEEFDQLTTMLSNNANISGAHFQQAHTAGIDPRLSQQQQDILMQKQYLAQMSAMNSAPVSQPLEYQNQANLQLQMMQIELMRIHALAQMQQRMAYATPSESHPFQRHGSRMFEPPATAGPRAQSFPLNDPGYQNQFCPLPVETPEYGPVPMTAGINGRFGSRANSDQVSNQTRSSASSMMPSKSDSAVSWRRGSTHTTEVVRSSSGSPSSSDSEKGSGSIAQKIRPKPLHFTDAETRVAASNDDSELGSDSTSSRSDTEPTSSSPTTPMSSNSNPPSISSREEASKKMLQGIGMGRPSIHVTTPSEGQVVISVLPRVILQPIRQPRGPPGAVDELGDKNFANRIRKKAIGGLGALLEARERRDWADIESV